MVGKILQPGGAVSILTLGMLLGGTPALAQETLPTKETQGPRANGPESQIEDIVVTARRQAESLQKTPVAVTALSQETIDRLNINQPDRLSNLAPNLAITQQTASTTASSIYIRGIGEQNPILTSESGVGLYLDGVYLARTSGAIFDLVDLERIEVLRGPQGTLFGRNTTGGAVQLVSRAPSSTFQGKVKAGYGSFNDWYAQAQVDTGDIGGAPVRASVTYMHRGRDGYVDNRLTPDRLDPGSLNSDALRARVEAEIGPAKINYAFDYNDRRGSPIFFQLVAASPDVAHYYGNSSASGGAPFLLSRDYLKDVLRTEGQVTARQSSTSRITGHSLTFEIPVTDALTFKSISAYRTLDVDFIFGLSGNGDLKGVVLDPISFAPSIASVTPIQGFQRDRQRQWSQEFQLLGATDNLKYVLGLFYFREKVASDSNQFLTFVLPGGDAGMNLQPRSTFSAISQSYAAFGQVSYRPSLLDERFELTAGLRYTRDEKSLAQTYPQPVTGKTSFDNTSWLLSAGFDVAPDILAYARATSGYKAGGFNPSAPFLNLYGPEKALAFELGLKSRWLDGRLQANIALFDTRYDDLQVQQFVAGSAGSQSIYVNAGKARYRGIEVELKMVPIRGLNLESSLGYTDPKYKSFLYRDPITDQVTDIADSARFPYLSKLTTHAAIEYGWNVGGSRMSARIDYAYRSGRDFHPVPQATPFMDAIRDHGRHDLSARLTLSKIPLGPAQGEISLWGANLLDRHDIGSGIDFGSLGFAGVAFVPPRTFGVDLQAGF
jgi:iron complex outermembrane receptor protein